ncbi:MAG: vWA domain-containing protein [Candidatus Binatia bacterium]
MKKINEKGQILIFVSLGFVLLGLFTGLAVDLTRGYLLKARLHRAVDAAAIAAAKILKGQTALEPQATAAACDAAMINGLSCSAPGANILVNFVDKAVPGGANMRFVQITGQASISTTMLRLLSFIGAGDFSTLNVTAFAEAGPERPVDLILALDRSGSMGQSDGTGTQKLVALKISVSEFLNNNFTANDQVGMVSFATRGCGNASGGDSTVDGPCMPDQPLAAVTSGYLTTLVTAVNGMDAAGGTNTMEALRTAGIQINDTFSDPSRATSRKVVLLITDGQPTFMRRSDTGECNTNPASGGGLPPGGPFLNGCLHGVPLWKSPSVWSPTEWPGMFRVSLTAPNSFPCSTRIPPFNFGPSDPELPCGPNTDATVRHYRDVIGATRLSAMQRANTVRGYGPDKVAIFVIAIGKDTSMTDPQSSLDANALCLLARIANDPNSISNCGSVFTTALDGDLHSELKCAMLVSSCINSPGPPSTACFSDPSSCINSSQQQGRVFTVNMAGDVTQQLRDIFGEVAALLKLRLTI